MTANAYRDFWSGVGENFPDLGGAASTRYYAGNEQRLFTEHFPPLEGLKLIGFSVWERKTGSGRNVTFPARTYSVNGERRSFALLRPVGDTTAQNRVRDLVLQAYAEFETHAALASAG